ncbi:MAG: ribbon-helix-helix domain-containing protein [Actinomycetota bacterium]|nr:ribbon-helix-helix domain-containing protein [Actinomycetota bacterium]
MKLSVSLPDEDVEFVDAYAREQGAESRSAVIREAVRLLRASGLDSDYAQAWDEWADSDDSDAWESVIADGLTSTS